LKKFISRNSFRNQKEALSQDEKKKPKTETCEKMEYITFKIGVVVGVLCSVLNKERPRKVAKYCAFTAISIATRFINFFRVRFPSKFNNDIDMWMTKSGRREFLYTAFGRRYVVSCQACESFRKPSNIVSVMASGGDGRMWEVTTEIEERMGPQGDCHGIGGISIDWIDGAEKLFVETLDSEFVITRS
jgi:hypothetical protein